MVALRKEFSSWRSHFEDINQYLLPRRGRFITSKRNLGEKLNQKIINGSAGFALNSLSAGLMGGMTSPARPWFRLTVDDLALRDLRGVKEWLDTVRHNMLQIFSKSNLYKVLPAMYEQLGAYGTAAMIVHGDEEDVIRCENFPIGSFYLISGPDARIQGIYREFSMTVDQMVQEFGLDNVSRRVAMEWQKGNTETWIEVNHLIEPNDERVDFPLFSDQFPFRSVWYEKSERKPLFLRRSGFEMFPVMAPRWWVNGEDVYGRSPGMQSLGDNKQLQHQESRKLQAIDRITEPPLQIPGAIKKINMMPGGRTSRPANGDKIEPLFNVDSRILEVREDIRDVQIRISRAFHEDLFLMLAQSDRRQVTAREVEEKHEEKLIQLGPVIERVHDELLNPLIQRTWQLMLEADQGSGQYVPPPPPELEGRDFQVEYISILAQAQRAVGLVGMERLVAFAQAGASLDPTAVDKLDFDAYLEEASEMLGVPARILRGEDEVASIRAARQQSEQMAYRVQMAREGAAAAKDASQTDVGDGDSLLSRLSNMAQTGDIAAPQPGQQLPTPPGQGT